LAYDGLGRVIREDQTFRGDTQTLTSSYDADLERRELHYPATAAIAGGRGPTVEFRFDKLGRVKQALSGGLDFLDYLYSGPQRVARRRAGHVDTHYLYDKERKPERIIVQSQERGLLWQSRASYKIHTPEEVSERFFLDGGRPGEGRSVVMGYDRLGRPVMTTTKVVTPSADGKTIKQVTSQLLQEYGSLGRVERIHEHTYNEAENVVTLVRTDQFTYTEAGRIDTTETTFRQQVDPIDFKVGGPPVFNRIDDALRFVSSVLFKNPEQRETQKFRYDNNGNLVADRRFVYFYDHRNRLTRVYDTFKRGLGPIELRGTFINFNVNFFYDPLGRRVYREFEPKVTDLPGKRFPDPKLQDVRFLYDQNRVIAEVDFNRETKRSTTLLARYFHGEQAHEPVRMDRRLNDRPDGALESYFLHAGFRGEISFLSDLRAAAVRTELKDQGVVEHERMVEGSTTRVPYSSWTTREEPFAGIQYRQDDGSYLFDYRSAPETFSQIGIPDDKFFQKRSAEIARRERERHLLALVPVLAPFALELMAPFAAEGLAAIGQSGVIGGLAGVGIDYGITSIMGGDYSIEQAYLAFGLGALSGGFGGAMANTVGTAGRLAYAAGIGLDVAAGTAVDVAFYGRSLQEALITNLAFSTGAAAAGFAVGRASSAALSGAKAIASTAKGWTRVFAQIDPSVAATPGHPSGGGAHGIRIKGTDLIVDEYLGLATASTGELAEFFDEVIGWLEQSRYGRRALFHVERAEMINIHFVRNARTTSGRRAGGSYKPPSTDIYVDIDHHAHLRDPRLVAATIVHEVEHALGGNELLAFRMQAQFLREIGIKANQHELVKMLFKWQREAWRIKQKAKEMGEAIEDRHFWEMQNPAIERAWHETLYKWVGKENYPGGYGKKELIDPPPPYWTRFPATRWARPRVP
jgi:hypothetical protein